MTPRPEDHIWWLASRASGIVALLLISASVILGLAMATKLLRQPGLPRLLSGLHEHLAVAAILAIALHGVTLLGDPWLRPGLDGIALPAAIGYRPAFVALGIVGGYLAAALGLSFYVRRRVGSKRWRSAHRFVVIAWVMAFVHAAGAGTDASTAWLRTPMIAIAATVSSLLALRILLSWSERRSEDRGRRPAPRLATPRPRTTGEA